MAPAGYARRSAPVHARSAARLRRSGLQLEVLAELVMKIGVVWLCRQGKAEQALVSTGLGRLLRVAVAVVADDERQRPPRQRGVGLLVDAADVADAARQSAVASSAPRRRGRAAVEGTDDADQAEMVGGCARKAPALRRPLGSTRRHRARGSRRRCCAPARRCAPPRSRRVQSKRSTRAPACRAISIVASTEPVSRTRISSTHGRALARQRSRQRASSRTIITRASRCMPGMETCRYLFERRDQARTAELIDRFRRMDRGAFHSRNALASSSKDLLDNPPNAPGQPGTWSG